jgi:hypothetical protein
MSDGVSRFGVIPKPTVKVRMEENGAVTLQKRSNRQRVVVPLLSPWFWSRWY